MYSLLDPALLNTLWTLSVGGLLLSAAALTLWALPWSDQAIRETDKALSPIDLTQESIASPVLSRA
jgi:hypothetical protein